MLADVSLELSLLRAEFQLSLEVADERHDRMVAEVRHLKGLVAHAVAGLDLLMDKELAAIPGPIGCVDMSVADSDVEVDGDAARVVVERASMFGEYYAQSESCFKDLHGVHTQCETCLKDLRGELAQCRRA